MKLLKTIEKRSKKNLEQGFALLEYSAGAAVVATILWFGMTNMGNGVRGMLDQIGTWAGQQSAQIGQDLGTGSAQE